MNTETDEYLGAHELGRELCADVSVENIARAKTFLSNLSDWPAIQEVISRLLDLRGTDKMVSFCLDRAEAHPNYKAAVLTTMLRKAHHESVLEAAKQFIGEGEKQWLSTHVATKTRLLIWRGAINIRCLRILGFLLILTTVSVFVIADAQETVKSEKILTPEHVGQEITLSGKFSWRGKYGPFIRSGEDDEWVYLENLDPRGQQDPKLHEGDLVTITAELQLSPGGRIMKVGKRMKLVWTAGYKWTGRRGAAIPLEYYYFDARQMKIESVKSP